ncbi:hypothetical protein [Bacillus cereus group sp. MYBK227-1]|uniref:hypothetical protein n=1 Tax=Bacillus cereus group sp. MYBK227-1 TaxID=3450654 RepID=UPI003F79527B
MKLGKSIFTITLAVLLLFGVQPSQVTNAASGCSVGTSSNGKFDTNTQWKWATTVCVPSKTLTIDIYYLNGSAATNVKVKNSRTGVEYLLDETFSGSNNNISFKLPETGDNWQIYVQSDEWFTNTKGTLYATGS